MKVLLINIEPHLENYALYKIERYHLDRGDTVLWNDLLYVSEADKIYVACIFAWNKEKALAWRRYPNAIIGGSGVDINLRLPAEIEAVNPHKNIGFCVRGCVRHCKFCIVPIKDGMCHAVNNLLDLWDGKSKEIILLDDNILGLPEHFFKVCTEAIQNKIQLNFHALDVRLLTETMAQYLRKVRHQEYKFAFDEIHNFNAVHKGITILQKYGIWRSTFYVLCGFNTTFEQDIFRCEYLKSRFQNAYVQKYNFTKEPRIQALATWVNQRHLFQKKSFVQFLNDFPSLSRYKTIVYNYFSEKGINFEEWYKQLQSKFIYVKTVEDIKKFYKTT
jgi:hypothetical protein